MGLSQNWGYLLGGPHDKDYGGVPGFRETTTCSVYLNADRDEIWLFLYGVSTIFKKPLIKASLQYTF